MDYTLEQLFEIMRKTGESMYDWSGPSVRKIGECNCDSKLLFDQGCQCGGFAEEMAAKQKTDYTGEITFENATVRQVKTTPNDMYWETIKSSTSMKVGDYVRDKPCSITGLRYEYSIKSGPSSTAHVELRSLDNGEIRIIDLRDLVTDDWEILRTRDTYYWDRISVGDVLQDRVRDRRDYSEWLVRGPVPNGIEIDYIGADKSSIPHSMRGMRIVVSYKDLIAYYDQRKETIE
jgi:hypothetical protein